MLLLLLVVVVTDVVVDNSMLCHYLLFVTLMIFILVKLFVCGSLGSPLSFCGGWSEVVRLVQKKSDYSFKLFLPSSATAQA